MFLNMFIGHADFNFPVQAIDFINKHLYLWSFQNGAVNFDGIIRLPGRLPVILVYELFGNVTASYFYIIFSYLILGVSFWVFLRYFFKSNSNLLNIFLALVYTFNPVFLSNTSKIGLVAAVGLLPLCLVLIKKFIDTKSLRHLFFLILCLNYSLIHPYTFTVNLIFAAGVFIFYIYSKNKKIFEYIPKIILSGFIALLLHLYIILPISYIGTISKDALSQNIAQEAVDYTSLVEIANAGSSINSLSLSKFVFLDYEYYSDSTKSIYIVAVLSLYFFAFASFIFLKNRLSKKDSIIFLASGSALLVLLFLTSGNEIANKIIVQLINLPGGWIFRSPLKWQFYIPLCLFTMIAVLLRYYRPKARTIITVFILFAGLLQSGYLVKEIYTKLIIPKSVTTFTALESLPNDSRMLYLSGKDCRNHLNSNGAINNELNQVFVSKYIQVKRASQASVSSINLSDYDYILICKEDGGLKFIEDNFEKISSIDNESFNLYKKVDETGKVMSLSNLYYIDSITNIPQKNDFVRETLGDTLNYTTSESDSPSKELVQVFENISSESVEDNELVANIDTDIDRSYNLYSRSGDIFLTINQNNIELSETPETGSIILKKNASLEIPNFDNTIVRLKGTENTNFGNLLSNGTFDTELWRDEVEDCYSYDDYPLIGMRLAEGVTGKALELSAGNHIACTSTTIDVQDDRNLYVSFDFKSLQTRSAGVSVKFNDTNDTIESFVARQPKDNQDWVEFSNTIEIPQGATSAIIRLYGYPDIQRATTLYDNVVIFEIPEILNDIYLVSDIKTDYSDVQIVTSNLSPTEKVLNVSNAKGEIMLKVNETYDTNWSLELISNNRAQHIKPLAINTYTQGWMIDIDGLCQNNSVCVLNTDGTYNLQLTNTYVPQKYFMYGLYASIFTLIVIYLFYVYEDLRGKR
jgi:hypothetical protein